MISVSNDTFDVSSANDVRCGCLLTGSRSQIPFWSVKLSAVAHRGRLPELWPFIGYRKVRVAARAVSTVHMRAQVSPDLIFHVFIPPTRRDSCPSQASSFPQSIQDKLNVDRYQNLYIKGPPASGARLRRHSASMHASLCKTDLRLSLYSHVYCGLFDQSGIRGASTT